MITTRHDFNVHMACEYCKTTLTIESLIIYAIYTVLTFNYKNYNFTKVE